MKKQRIKNPNPIQLSFSSLVILEDGSVLVGYRGTKCCCDELIGTWGMCGEHEYESASYLRFVMDTFGSWHL